MCSLTKPQLDIHSTHQMNLLEKPWTDLVVQPLILFTINNVAQCNIVNATLWHTQCTQAMLWSTWVVRHKLGSTPVLIASLHSRLPINYSQIDGDTWAQPTPQICFQLLCNA